jgi:hypothetical protein
VYVDYFTARTRRPDADNLAKCILDALNGIAYVADRHARLQSTRCHHLTEEVEIPYGPADLVKPLQQHPEYVLVRVRHV